MYNRVEEVDIVWREVTKVFQPVGLWTQPQKLRAQNEQFSEEKGFILRDTEKKV